MTRLLAHHKPVKIKESLTNANITPISPSVQSPNIDNPSDLNPIATVKPVLPQKKIIPVVPIVAPAIGDRPKPDVIHKPVIKAVKTSTNICSHCQSPDVAIAYVHSYFFKCNDCGKNTPIKNICPSCGDREKIRKSGLQFFAECEKCNTSRLFHTNSSTFTKAQISNQ